MKRRLLTVVLTLFYLLQATWLLHAGADLLFSPKKSTAAASNCGTCGCPDHDVPQKACCCFPHGAPAKTASAPSPHSTLDEARCQGTEAAMAQALTQPVVSGFASLDRTVAVASEIVLPDLHPHFHPFGTRLEKVPIAQA